MKKNEIYVIINAEIGRDLMILDANNICSLIDNNLAELIHMIITIFKIVFPILLVVFGMIDFFRAVASSKEDEIKAGQKRFIKRIITAVFVFLVISLVQFLTGLLEDQEGIWDCANLILNGK